LPATTESEFFIYVYIIGYLNTSCNITIAICFHGNNNNSGMKSWFRRLLHLLCFVLIYRMLNYVPLYLFIGCLTMHRHRRTTWARWYSWRRYVGTPPFCWLHLPISSLACGGQQSTDRDAFHEIEPLFFCFFRPLASLPYLGTICNGIRQ
jgi:hypothetical protein